MAKITRDEVLRIAWLSRIAFHENETEKMAAELQEVVTYAHRVCDIASDVTQNFHNNINIFREDLIISDDAKTIRDQAPEQAESFFVVPAVIDANE